MLTGTWKSVLLAVVLMAATTPASGATLLDFNRQVRPILAAHCFKCHGPDEKTREAGLRLDQRAAASKELDSRATAIVPGQPKASEVVRRIFSTDPDAVMPPPTANKPLSDEQKQILRQWIAEGASYQVHWAFVAPLQVVPPSVAGTLGVPLPGDGTRSMPATYASRSAIDAFVGARLTRAGLALSPEADRYTLIRRAAFDLIGLPPTPIEADAFASDPAPDAYERLIDRLLASPHYGERWARRWLDLARYADTNGYEKDRIRSMWPYRDWVIRALNADLPFDQFTIEQLAGDMLPSATLDQQIATGFHRNTMINEEGGIDPLEFRFYAMVDRVNTTATTWLGLTLGCAQCHTHKFDPITHADYYQQMAFLNNADEPTIDVPRLEIEQQRAEIERQIVMLIAELPNHFPAAEGMTAQEHLEQQFAAWLHGEAEKAVRWTALQPLTAKSEVPTLNILDDGSVFSTGDITKRDEYVVTLDIAGLRGITALRIEVMPDPRLPKNGPGRIYYEGPIGDFWLSEITASTLARSASDGLARAPLRIKSATHSFAAGKNDAAAALDGDPQTGWSINGGQGRTHYAAFQLESPLGEASQIELKLLFERYYAGAIGRFRVWATTDPRGGEARDLPRDVEELLLHNPDELTAPQRDRLLQQFVQVTPELSDQREKIKKLHDSLTPFPTTLVLQERPESNRRPTFLHHRGEFLQPKDRVKPELLSLFPSLSGDTPHNRLTYARWLVSPANPLVGRVTMNRHWAALFGTGLVRTTEDFGYQGEPPSHPELLDWLAVEFIRRGWSQKAMHRLIVTSSTYRQRSAISDFKQSPVAETNVANPEPPAPSPSSSDPQNRLLWHFPRQRLEAETVRDLVLSASGQLSAKLGGPSVFPPQPPSVTAEGAYGVLAWSVSPGEDRYRRGLYTFAKRTAPYAMFATFDGPSGEACLARREVTDSPLQALTMLNDAVIVEASQALGSELAADTRPVADQIQSLFRRCLTRLPTTSEHERLRQFYDAQLQRLQAKEIDALAIAGPGDGDAAQRAAWTLVARAILNLDEVITKE